jgi:hypothetical protein
MSERQAVPPKESRSLSFRDRALAWLVTGPLGRAAAFVADLGAAWWRWASKLRDR